MPKTLVLVRHAKTEDALPRQRDFDRELKPHGRAQAKQMSLVLSQKRMIPDGILSSPAVRAQQTAVLLAQTIGLDPTKILLDQSMYNASAGTLAEAIQQNLFPEDVETLLLVAHNPGISQLALQCAPDLPIDHLPTCGMVLLKADIRSWTDFVPQACRLSSLELP